MTERADYIVVGSGLTGATIARALADAGREVLVLERRSQPGGNVHDHVHSSGIRVHTYGPHYFRTSSEQIWTLVRRFAEFVSYKAVIKSVIDGAVENWPVTEGYIRRAVGGAWTPDFTGVPTNFEQAALRLMPRVVYEKFVKGYTEKQWGVPAYTLSADLVKRFDVRPDHEPYLSLHKYQGLPREGYTSFMQKMLEGIPLRLNTDYLSARDQYSAKEWLIFTGPIDEYFGFDCGHLKYRGQRRTHEYLPQVDFIQPGIQVNNPNPNAGAHIRTLEWKHLMPEAERTRVRGTVVTRETPYTPTNPEAFEYPFPDATNAALYARYRQQAQALERVLICGRLGEYRYYDMDQAIGRALVLANRLLQ